MRVSKNVVNEIRSILEKYRRDIDELAENYDMKYATRYGELAEHKNDYTESYMRSQIEKLKQSVLSDFKPTYDRLHQGALDSCDFYLSTAKRQLDAFYSCGCRPEFGERLRIYPTFGIRPSVKELELLAHEASNFTEKQAVKGLIMQLKEPQETTFYNPYKKGNDKTDAKVAEYNPYSVVSLDALGLDDISLDSAYKLLDDYAEKVKLLINHYCSANADFYDITGHGGYSFDVSPEVYNFYVKGGSDFRPEKVKNKNFETFGINASNFFESTTARELESMIDRINRTTERKTKLTASEKSLLNSLFGEIPSYALKNAVRGACDELPQIASLVEISDKYSKYLDD